METVNFVATRSRTTAEPRQLLTPSDYKEGMTVADLIRKIHKDTPDASNGEVSRFLTIFIGKPVRPQWVYNVLHTELKRK